MLKIHHYAMEVFDINKVSNFYKDLLDFVEDEKVEFPGEVIIFLRNGEAQLELIESKQESMLSRNVHLCLETVNIQKVIERFLGAGVPIVEGPLMLKNGWKTVFFLGPAGEMIEFLEP
ncbi:VOC family protein [Bacillus sp. 1P10SD]|uniref:VOC family protein n=1 Tax=Bacillus sp. 1P10SD TaxID=3132265 RepID=UPI0039A5ACA0